MQLHGLDEIDAKAISVSGVKPDTEGDIRYIRNPAHDGPAISQTYLDETVVVHCVGNVSYIFLVVHDAASLSICHLDFNPNTSQGAVNTVTAFIYMSQDINERFISF